MPEPMPIPSPAPAAETAAQPPAPSPEPEPPAEPGEEVAGLGHPKGRFASLGQKLAHFSRAVSNATRDVERTEDLVRGIADATEKVVEMGSLVAAIRDQANLIAFKAGVREARGAEDNLVLFSPDVKLPPDSAEAQSSARFDQMRDMVDRAERTVQAAHAALVGVTGIAQEVAAGASNQALEATQQLLAQSEYLHHMLDDVLARVRPHAQPAKGEKPKPESGRDKA
ncbi:MAG: hypothetical protein FJX37_00005 [Alphaproteobacteria bacterium]|nr:hypothetical protein [Alphaproteobacteria bacterium]